MTTFFRTHFPSTKSRLVFFFKLYYPMMIGSTLYALNGFVDNFMVGHIEQGAAALSSVNSWTNIVMGIFVGLGSAGSVINARYYFAGEFEKAQQLYKLRLLLSLIFASCLALVAWSSPGLLIKVFLKDSGDNSASYQLAFKNSEEYLRIIAISWILIAISSSTANTLREIGHGKASMYWGYMTITTNIMLNSILMYGFNFGVDGAAYASVAARIVAILFGFYWLLTKNTKISFKIWTIFFINWEIIKNFLNKWYLFVSSSIVILFITFRNYFYDAGYTVDEQNLGVGLGAMSVLAISSAIMNIFTTTFSAAGAMSANTVGKELAKGKTKSAFSTAKELKGFLTTISAALSILLAIVAAILPFMHFLSENKYDNFGQLIFDGDGNLYQARDSLWVICLFFPIWIWFVVSYRSAVNGKKGFWFSFVDMFVAGPIQLGWAALLAYQIIPSSDYIASNFFVCYGLFFLSDLLKLVGMEVLFYKYKWNQKIDDKRQKEVEIQAEDDIAASQIDMK